jgi:hypothetical protein
MHSAISLNFSRQWGMTSEPNYSRSFLNGKSLFLNLTGAFQLASAATALTTASATAWGRPRAYPTNANATPVTPWAPATGATPVRCFFKYSSLLLFFLGVTLPSGKVSTIYNLIGPRSGRGSVQGVQQRRRMPRTGPQRRVRGLHHPGQGVQVHRSLCRKCS